MKYVDGFVLVIPKGNLPAYQDMAQKAGQVWKEYGALEYIESVGEDLSPDVPAEMKGIPFPQMIRAKPGETVVFSFIVYKSREHRDEVNAKVMKDPMMSNMDNKQMPFDMKRMAYGGFKVIVEA